MHQSIPAVPMPPGQPRGICSRCQPGGGGEGHSQILWRPGSWALAYPRATPGHLTHVFSKDGWVYREGRGLFQSQSFPPKESIKCINLRPKRYIVLIFFTREKTRSVRLAKAENCSFVQKRWNFATRLLVVYVGKGDYKVTFSYENLSMSTCTYC